MLYIVLLLIVVVCTICMAVEIEVEYNIFRRRGRLLNLIFCVSNWTKNTRITSKTSKRLQKYLLKDR